jgi:hypothetical protein
MKACVQAEVPLMSDPQLELPHVTALVCSVLAVPR